MRLKQIFLLLVLIQVFISNASAKTFLIHSEEDFKKVVKNLSSGDSVVVADGNYSLWSETVMAAGTQSSPIVISAETPGKVIFSGNVSRPVFQITGSYITLSGFTFRGCTIPKNSGVLIELQNSASCRITNCTFEKNVTAVQYRPIVVISGNGTNNKVDHCNFISNVNNQDVQVRIKKGECPLYTIIEDNVFKEKDRVTWPSHNGGECIQVGQNNMLFGNAESKVTVRNNRFIRCNGDAEVISNKSSGNVYSNNYFEDCNGELVLRGGHSCLVDSNTFRGGFGGIRINGTGHQIINNIINGTKTGIRLSYGMTKGKEETGYYIAASECIINNNLIENTETGILIGLNKNHDWTGKLDARKAVSKTIQDNAPSDNQINNNKFLNNKKDTISR